MKAQSYFCKFVYKLGATHATIDQQSCYLIRNLSMKARSKRHQKLPGFGRWIRCISALSLMAAFLLAGMLPSRAAEVIGWGSAYFGKTIAPADLNHVVAIAGSGFGSVALRANGSIVCWGDIDPGQNPLLTDMVAIAAGHLHFLALRTDSTVVAWSNNWQGATDVPPGLSNVVAIAAGWAHSLALRTDGTVVAWGNNESGGIKAPVNLRNVVAIAAGDKWSMALQANGMVVVWGGYSDHYVPPDLHNAVAIASGWYHGLALRADGTVVSWDYNSNYLRPVPAGLTNVIAISAGWSHSLALRADGTVVGWGQYCDRNDCYPIPVPADLNNVVAIASGPWHNLALAGQGPPILSAPMAHRTVISGETAYFHVVATGDRPLNYQWLFNGANLPGAIHPTLVLTNVQMKQAGRYALRVSNALGTVVHPGAELTVTPFLITTADVAPTVSVNIWNDHLNLWVGENLALEATATGAPYPVLQWQYNGTELPGQTNRLLTLTNLQTNQSGIYTVVASNGAGICVSKPVTLLVRYQAPRISSIYSNQESTNVLVQNDVVFFSSYVGSSPLSFQWWFNGVELPGQTNANIWLSQVETNQTGIYRLSISNIAGATTSKVMVLNVQYQKPMFVTEPSSQTVIEGATVRMAGHTRAGPPATHTLQFNGSIIGVPQTFVYSEGGFTLMDVTPADAGEYCVIASNSLGVVTSRIARLTVIPAGAFDRWTPRNPLPQSQRLFSLAHNGSIWTAVGDQGTLLTSTDGTRWAIQSRRVNTRLYGVTYGGGQFMAVGASGIVLSSTDATNWVYRYSAPDVDLYAVTYGNGRFVITGTKLGVNVFLTSMDGITWQQTMVSSCLAELGIAYGNDAFVAVGTSAIARSTNGLDWTVVRYPLVDELEDVAYYNHQFIAVGNNGSLFVSTDGQAWSPRYTETSRRLLGITFSNGTYVATGVRGMILTSKDTVSWKPANSGTPDRLEAVGFANGRFVVVGENGTTLASSNAETWTKQNIGITRDLDGMATANGLLVAVGKGGSILTSVDGVNFKVQNAGITNDLHGIGWGNGLWVVVGEPGIILTSSNAIQWTSRLVSTASSLKAVNYGNGRWIVVGTQGTIATSRDGKTWYTTITTPNYDLNDAAYGNGIHLIVGDGISDKNGSSFSSPDGLEWTWNNNWSFGKNLRGIYYTNGIFLVTANDLSLYTTANGVNWTNLFVPLSSSMEAGLYPGPRNLRCAFWAHGQWIVAGNSGAIFTSPDMGIWTRRPNRTVENLHEIVYLNGRLITIGNRGTIMQSDMLLSELEPDGFKPAIGFELAVKGLAGYRYELQTSTDLISWTNIGVVTNTTERTLYTDSNAVAYPYRYYRLLESLNR